VIAASAPAVLIAIDRGPIPRRHFGFVASVSDRSDAARPASANTKSSATTLDPPAGIFSATGKMVTDVAESTSTLIG